MEFDSLRANYPRISRILPWKCGSEPSLPSSAGRSESDSLHWIEPVPVHPDSESWLLPETTLSRKQYPLWKTLDSGRRLPEWQETPPDIPRSLRFSACATGPDCGSGCRCPLPRRPAVRRGTASLRRTDLAETGNRPAGYPVPVGGSRPHHSSSPYPARTGQRQATPGD